MNKYITIVLVGLAIGVPAAAVAHMHRSVESAQNERFIAEVDFGAGKRANLLRVVENGLHDELLQPTMVDFELEPTINPMTEIRQ